MKIIGQFFFFLKKNRNSKRFGSVGCLKSNTPATEKIQRGAKRVRTSMTMRVDHRSGIERSRFFFHRSTTIWPSSSSSSYAGSPRRRYSRRMHYSCVFFKTTVSLVRRRFTQCNKTVVITLVAFIILIRDIKIRGADAAAAPKRTPPTRSSSDPREYPHVIL